jgi:hypothetical protein
MDDIYLSPELDGTLVCPLLDTAVNIRRFWGGRSREKGTTVNTNWEQNASA